MTALEIRVLFPVPSPPHNIIFFSFNTHDSKFEIISCIRPFLYKYVYLLISDILILPMAMLSPLDVALLHDELSLSFLFNKRDNNSGE